MEWGEKNVLNCSTLWSISELKHGSAGEDTGGEGEQGEKVQNERHTTVTLAMYPMSMIHYKHIYNVL